MKKSELVEILNSVGVPVDEGESKIANAKTYPRIVYWDYIWQDIMASGNEFTTVETYQISFFSKKPRSNELLKLREKLREKEIHPMFTHEFVKEENMDSGVYHTYFSVDIETNE